MNPSPKTPALRLGSFSKKAENQASHWMPKRIEFDAPDRITNAASTGVYSAVRDLSYRGMGVRHPSKGGC